MSRKKAASALALSSTSESTIDDVTLYPIKSSLTGVSLNVEKSELPELPKHPKRLAYEKRWNVLDEKSVDLPLAQRTWEGKMEFGAHPKFLINYLAIPKPQVKRQEIIHEILLTEIDYYQDLQIIIVLYMKNMKSLRIIPDEEIAIIFSNIETLLILSKKFIDRLQIRKRRDVGIVKEIGDIIIEMAEQFKIYHIYCSNFSAATTYLQNKKSNTDFTSLLQVIQA